MCLWICVPSVYHNDVRRGSSKYDPPLDDYSSVSVDGRKLGVYIVGFGVSHPLPYPDRIPQIWSTDTS